MALVSGKNLASFQDNCRLRGHSFRCKNCHVRLEYHCDKVRRRGMTCNSILRRDGRERLVHVQGIVDSMEKVRFRMSVDKMLLTPTNTEGFLRGDGTNPWAPRPHYDHRKNIKPSREMRRSLCGARGGNSRRKNKGKQKTINCY
jgi:hypothetical protein